MNRFRSVGAVIQRFFPSVQMVDVLSTGVLFNYATVTAIRYLQGPQTSLSSLNKILVQESFQSGFSKFSMDLLTS